MSQTAYTEQAAVAFAGLIADSPGFDMFIQSLANEDVADAAFGLGYFLGTDGEKQFVLPAGSAGTFAGVLAHRHQTEQRGLFTTGGAGGSTGLKTGEPGDMVRRGRIWVVTGELVAAGDPAFVRHTTANFGEFFNDAQTATAQAVNGRFAAVASATLALLELNEP
jgi:FAD/FMN-containing dehydrogenase